MMVVVWWFLFCSFLVDVFLFGFCSVLVWFLFGFLNIPVLFISCFCSVFIYNYPDFCFVFGLVFALFCSIFCRVLFSSRDCFVLSHQFFSPVFCLVF